MKVTDFSVHLAYTTYPNENEKGFIDSKINIFTNYIKNSCSFLDENLDEKTLSSISLPPFWFL